MVLALVSVCTRPSNSQQQRKEGVGGENDGNAHEKNPSRSGWTTWSCDRSPVARRAARMDYVMDLGGLAGASGSMPAWVDGAGAMMSSAFASKGQPASGSANVIGTQHEQPEVQHPPLQAGAVPRLSSRSAEATSAVARASAVVSWLV
jgi:hypothetical protein